MALAPSAGIAIFCMLLTYYMWIKAVKTGSIYWAAMCALAYFYMVSVPSPRSGLTLTLRSLWMHSPGSHGVLFRVSVSRELEPLEVEGEWVLSCKTSGFCVKCS